ncbi:hypothetical protein [Halalkalibacter sp. APA_J-10(15)]|uniref:hypothetical protein n=1 Tax=unclassified Halalkalibacter TaxID=2893063 RepID=UPI001FF533E5|nr:hypothetical protein [Halalkalibacter sp. APA_J-10(15)]MCK0472825.1 hypothetical protein [Halalkalibacter sp. APA_J-10(15)]
MMRIVGRVGFYPLFFFAVICLVLGPFMAIDDIRATLQYGTPHGAYYLFMIGFCSFFLYLSIRIETLQWIYYKLPILWPVLQMCLFMLMATGLGATFLHHWAEHNFPSKGVAITLAIVSFVVVRIVMSWWFARHPASSPFVNRRYV